LFGRLLSGLLPGSKITALHRLGRLTHRGLGLTSRFLCILSSLTLPRQIDRGLLELLGRFSELLGKLLSSTRQLLLTTLLSRRTLLG
jgi:hypothetical protein